MRFFAARRYASLPRTAGFLPTVKDSLQVAMLYHTSKHFSIQVPLGRYGVSTTARELCVDAMDHAVAATGFSDHVVVTLLGGEQMVEGWIPGWWPFRWCPTGRVSIGVYYENARAIIACAGKPDHWDVDRWKYELVATILHEFSHLDQECRHVLNRTWLEYFFQCLGLSTRTETEAEKWALDNTNIVIAGQK